MLYIVLLITLLVALVLAEIHLSQYKKICWFLPSLTFFFSFFISFVVVYNTRVQEMHAADNFKTVIAVFTIANIPTIILLLVKFLKTSKK
ncbi:MAG: hypothetical protein LBU32_04335 [Clostridiales bacterium]|jgi:hypothetical protein|nr:hypothetical protein [Clostridiales bacterium]